MSITISSGITRFKKNQVVQAMIHNHRLENSHKNIKNQNTNYYYDLKTGQQKKVIVLKEKDEERAKVREEAKALYQKHFDNQMKLMSERNKSKGYSKPRPKDINPIAEGVVNFGNVYDIRNATDKERIEKTERFHNSFTEKEWSDIFEQIKNNVQAFCTEMNVELLDITFHRDEEGINHAHYLLTNYNPTTGEHLNIRHNKGGVGNRLQEIISTGMDKYGMIKAPGRDKKKSMTKEELIRYRAASEEIGKQEKKLEAVNKEIEVAEEELRIIKNNIQDCEIEASKIVFILNHFITELSEIDPNDSYSVKSKLMKLLKSAQWAIGKGKMDVAQSKLDHLEKILVAMDRKGKTSGMANQLKELRDNDNPIQ